MSEEELNQELSTDELKDVAGGCASKEWVDPNTEEIITAHVGKEFLGGSGDRARSKKLDKDQIEAFDINNYQK